ncbi:cell division protein DamX [Alteromonas sp. 1_MG-2023]|uniref:SPOR domain-containing protein n=1 Tax=Alteromonas sp. 1_MG-2023 TaxID=3062669 RepID=UPI0026E1235E|nr:SPOR domain-containing protein [Alteromonas sp. 1_MG-2023]MDO6567833.1 cell division protein DamX [Alteromonas sp. 1_MG-2023]
MHSELHERLEYLVNYSSQLVFVSGNSIAEQQQTLEAFVYQQHDDTEIAYLTAESNMDLTDYRGQLCRQLLGQVVGSFVRPLNELLSPLNSHEGPVLIAITQAEHMPDKLLQELWDLVLQSRFAGNKQHLNVLLFASTPWAEKAKKWLPAKNTDTPLLISSQSISSKLQSAKPQGSELDRMIAQRREAFQAHLDKRNLPVEAAPSNPLTTTGFYIAITLVFILTFGGLVAWQYGDSISTLFAPIEQQAISSESDDVVAGSAFSKVANEQEIQPVEPATSANDSNVELVTNWKGAVSSLGTTGEKSKESDNTASDDKIANNSVESGARATPASTAPQLSEQQNVLNENDNESASKPELLNELASNSSGIIETTTESLPSPAQPKQIQPKQIQQSPDISGASNTSTNQVVSSTAAVLKAESVLPNDYVIQMVGIKDETVVSQFIAQYNLSAVTRQYVTTRYGGDWHVVVFHQPFQSLPQARAALSALPDYPTKDEAFIKRGQQILDEMAAVSGE